VSVGRNFLASVLKSGDLGFLAQYDLSDDLFTAGENELKQVIIHHVKEFSTIPGLEAITTATGGEVSELPDVTESPRYYYDQMEKRRISKVLQKALIEAGETLQALPPEPEKALENVLEAATALYLSRNRNRIIDFRKSEALIHEEVAKALSQTGTYMDFGWHYLDGLTAGLRGGDVCSYVGRPSRGKTWFLLWTALHAWRKQELPVMFVSMEMNKEIILQRLASIYTETPVSYVMTGELGVVQGPKFKKKLKGVSAEDSPLWVVDGNRYVSVEDIYMLAIKLQPAVIVIDGAYMLRHPGKRLGRFERIAETADQIKFDIAANLDIPTLCSYQFGREMEKKQKKKTKQGEAVEKPGVEDIFGSDTIGQVSSIVLGLLEADTVETIHRRQISVLKGRHGEKGEFFVNWNFKKMDFSQWEEPKILDVL